MNETTSQASRNFQNRSTTVFMAFKKLEYNLVLISLEDV
jgi:hypothetical protein